MRYHVKDAYDVAYGTDHAWDLMDVEIPSFLPDQLREAAVVDVLYDRDLIPAEVEVETLENGFNIRDLNTSDLLYVLVAKPAWV